MLTELAGLTIAKWRTALIVGVAFLVVILSGVVYGLVQQGKIKDLTNANTKLTNTTQQLNEVIASSTATIAFLKSGIEINNEVTASAVVNIQTGIAKAAKAKASKAAELDAVPTPASASAATMTVVSDERSRIRINYINRSYCDNASDDVKKTLAICQQ